MLETCVPFITTERMHELLSQTTSIAALSLISKEDFCISTANTTKPTAFCILKTLLRTLEARKQ